ncbi:MAG TPA: pirin family protein [Pseudomonadales bacterium]|nr:pirin family protein [Pseudomonadales bacterium]
MEIRTAEERGSTRLAWLDSRHSFSFGYYYDPARLGVSSLRVINDDWVAPGGGFDTHGHRDMEILTYVTDGELVHRDSMGNHFSLRAGDVQLMRAGTGVTHSEFNGSNRAPVSFLQIWIQPAARHLAPHYEQLSLSHDAKNNCWINVGSPAGSDGEGVKIAQDVWIWAATLHDQTLQYAVKKGRQVYGHVVRGEVSVNGSELKKGDAALIREAESVAVTGNGEILVFDLINAN